MSVELHKKVGLALGGGAARGMAHIGVLSVLSEAGIPISYVAGSSAGSLIGAFYCAGIPLEKIKEFTEKIRWWHISRLAWPWYGLLCFDKLSEWLIKHLGDNEFSDLVIPYTVVATDLERGIPVKLSAGRLAPAVQASCSIPGLVTPVCIDGRMLGDGCVSDSVPVGTLREMGAEYVIGVDIFLASIRRGWGFLGMGFNAIEIMVERAGGGIEQADCLIVPDLKGKTYIRFSKREEFYLLGRQAALASLDKIRSDLGIQS